MASAPMIGSRIKVGIIGDLQPGLNSKKNQVEIMSTGAPVIRSDSDSIFSCSGSCFSLAGNFQFPHNRRGANSNTSHTACADAHTLSAHHIPLIPCTTSLAQDSRLPLLCAQNSRFISSLSRDVSCSAQNTQPFILYFFLCCRSPKVAHIQNFLR